MNSFILLQGKYNGGIFKNNKSKNQDASKLLEIAKNNSQRLFRLKEKGELGEYLKHVETCLELFHKLKHEGQERMVTGYDENGSVNIGNWRDLLDELLARFDGFVGKLKGNIGKIEKSFDTGRFRKRMEENVKIEEMRVNMKEKSFEFIRNRFARSDEKLGEKIPKLKMKKFEGTALVIIHLIRTQYFLKNLIVVVLKTVSLISVVIKRVSVVKGNITPLQFVKKN